MRQPRILVVDDERLLVETAARILRGSGYEVQTAISGREAIEILEHGTLEAVVSDIKMPEMDGIELLRAVRERDADVPVVLMTGSPDLASAVEAVTYGALQYLLKPFDMNELKKVIARAVRLCRIARVKKEALVLVNEGGLGASDRAGLEVMFSRAVDTLWMAYQPLVRARDQTLFGYEALLRTEESGLPNPGAVLDAAERLGRLPELGIKIRASAAAPIENAPEHALLFVNVNAADLIDSSLTEPDAPLSRIAHRVVLEITERASLDQVKDPRSRIAELRAVGFRIAIDDLGAGYAGLTSFAAMEPQFVKLDGSLVRGVDRNPTKQRLIRSMTSLCNDLAIITVAEAIETVAERETLVDLGCDLLQGYLLAKPDRPFPSFTW
jgi:EAL domain-containing protein (putative c-di-GMP-specific phosphodiesterase class I)/CheY-like chemotaxis protein